MSLNVLGQCSTKSADAEGGVLVNNIYQQSGNVVNSPSQFTCWCWCKS